MKKNFIKRAAMLLMACVLAFGGIAAVPKSDAVMTAEAATAQQKVNKVGVKFNGTKTTIAKTGDYTVTVSWSTYDNTAIYATAKSMSGYYTNFYVTLVNLDTGRTIASGSAYSKQWTKQFLTKGRYRVTVVPRYKVGNKYKNGKSYSTTFTLK